MRILIVEDEVLIAWMLAECLECAGHEVIGPAAAMAEALALCEAAAALPELAVLDINLRGGSNGVEVARALLERWGVRSIFASSDEMLEARRARTIALGCVRKPYRPETVLRGVEVAREVMDGRTPGCVPAGFELFSATE
jgi:two-component system, response regulator PdtaR